MLKTCDKKIGTRELTAILVAMMGLKASNTTPDLLILDGKNATWVIPLLSSLVMLIPIFLLLLLVRKHNQGLVELIFKLTGRWAGSILCAVLFFIIFNATMINSRGYADIVNALFYPLSPILLLLSLLIAFSYLIASRGWIALSRTAWLSFWPLLLIGVLLIVFVWSETNWLHLFPLAGSGLQPLFTSSLKYSSIYGDVILIFALYPQVRTYSNFRSAVLLGLGISCLIIVVFCALISLVFDYPAMEYINYPYHQLARAATIGGTLTHFEAIFLGFWILGAVIHFAIYLFLTALFFAKSVHLDDFTPLLLPFAVLIVLVGVIPDNITIMNEYDKLLLMFSSGVLVALPVVLTGLDRLKGKGQR